MEMKLTATVISILVLQTSAMSFFEEYDEEFTSVDTSFGQVLNDVVSDVRITIDCTILQVEQTLSFGGVFRDAAEYASKCQNANNENATPTDVREDSYPPPSQPKVEQPHEITKRHNEVTNLSQEIEKSISNTNQTINTLLDKNDAYEKIENVKSVLKNETERLTEVNALLSQELDKISTQVEREFKKLECDQNQPSVDDVLSEVKFLYELEQVKQNTAEANEIQQVFDEVLSVLHENRTTSSASTDKEIEEIMLNLEKTSNETFTDIENQFSQWKEDEKQHIREIENLVENQYEKRDASTDDFPKTFRDVVQKIIDGSSDTETQDQINDGLNNQPKTVKIQEESLPPTPIPSEEKPSSFTGTETELVNTYFTPKDPEAHKEAVNDATKIIKESQMSQKFLQKLFSNVDESKAVNVFDNPDLLNFS